MKSTDMPFNISIMKVDADAVRHLRQVSVTDIMETTGQKLGPVEFIQSKDLTWGGNDNITSDFHPDGLFSVDTFGRIGEKRRDSQFAYIDIKVKIFHPIIYKALGKLKGLYLEIISGKAYATWDENELDFVTSNETDGQTGFNFFVKHWENIKFKRSDSPLRNERIKLIAKYKDSAMTNKVLVLPAGLRDVRVGSNNRLEFDEINDVYRRIVGISRTIASSNETSNSPALNYSRYQLQMGFNEVYSIIEKMLKDKKGFIQSKWARRRVFNSTRNVISAMDTSKRLIGDKNGPKVTDTIMGLYQAAKGAMPLTTHLLRNGYLAEAFGINDNSTSAKLVDPKTLKQVIIDIPSTTKDRWTTLDGIEKIVNSLKDVENRHKHVMVEGYYLALIYKGPDKSFRIFGDIDDLPSDLNPEHVEPISLIEFIYLSGYREWNTLKTIITRYPVTGLGSTYPSDVYVKTSTVGEQRHELGPDWKPLGDEFIAPEFPTKKPMTFLDSLVVSSTRIKGLGAD